MLSQQYFWHFIVLKILPDGNILKVDIERHKMSHVSVFFQKGKIQVL
jgi:hypothetical protein